MSANKPLSTPKDAAKSVNLPEHGFTMLDLAIRGFMGMLRENEKEQGQLTPDFINEAEVALTEHINFLEVLVNR